MMFLDPYFAGENGSVRISPQQASRFAKEIAGDFNPIHDAGNKRFCVPGDLLFALVLARLGLSRKMRFRFAGMVGGDQTLGFPSAAGDALAIQDQAGKTYLEVSRSGETTQDPTLIENLIRSYVRFSGQNFPHILVPLMEQQGVMINPERPLVIYDSMSFDLERLDLSDLTLELLDSTLEVKGKRGEARLYFVFRSAGHTLGTGFKKLVLSGLREYQQDAIQGLVNRYEGWKAAYRTNGRVG